MFIKYIRFFLILVLSNSFEVRSQSGNFENPWIFGVGINLINDSVETIEDLFDLKDNYHYQTPISLSLEKRFKNDFGLEGRINFNKQIQGKKVNGLTLQEDVTVIAFDGHLKYYITNLWLNARRAIYEGYLSAGPGVTFFDSSDKITANFAVGINWFLSEQTRFNTQAVLKEGVSGNPANSYIQFNFGIIFRLNKSRSCSCY